MDVESEEVRFSCQGGPLLAGSLALPRSRSTGSAVLMVGGSGPTERTNDGYFEPVRAALLERGAAVLTYDKRGSGVSEGCWYDASLDALAADAGAGLSLLRRRTGVSPERTAVFGHSEGAWVALRLGVSPRPPARLLLGSGPSVPFLDAEVYALRAAGSSAQHAVRAGELLAELARSAATGADVTVGHELTCPVAETDWFLELRAAGFGVDEVSWAQLRAWGGYDPHADLSVLRVPTLSLFGSDDPLVPVARSVAVNRATAATAGRTHRNEVIAGVGHRMSAGETSPPSRRFLELVDDWCTFSR